MKVGVSAQYLSRANGGVSEAVRLSVAALHHSGLPSDQPYIALFTADDAFLGQDRAQFGTIPLHIAKPYGPKGYGFAPGMIGQLLASDIDILHVHGIWSFNAAAAWIWHRLTGKPVVIAPHGMLEPWILKRSRLLKGAVWRLYLRDLFRRAGGVQALTPKEAEDISAVLPGQLSTIIAHFVPLREEVAPEHPAWWDASFAGKRVFVFFGRLHVKKGILELCEAWERFCAEQPELARGSKLVFCGWNDGVPGFEERVAELAGKHGNISYAGPQYGEEKWRSLGAAGFMLLPSHSEGLPMAVIEAWSAGTPSIMTPACNIPDGFSHGAALEIEPTVESILDGLTRAAHMPEGELATMRAAARRLVGEQYSAQAVAEKTMAFYHEALASGAGRNRRV